MNDLRFASRTLRHNPSFTLVAIVALALGIGATTAIFSVVDAVLLRPLPYPESDRLVSVSMKFPGQDPFFVPSWDYLDWVRDNRVLDAYAAMGRIWKEPLQLPDEPVSVRAVRVTPNILEVLRVSPLLGRGFVAGDASTQLLISHALWQTSFAGDPKILEKSVNFDGSQRRIVGVLPPGFTFPSNLHIDALVPLKIPVNGDEARKVGAAWDTIGRLRNSVNFAQARANFETLFAASVAAEPRMYRNVQLRLMPFQERLTGSMRSVLLILLAGVGSVLLIACANVANLLLARATARQREIAIRLALGASRLRLIRQLLTESLLISSIGGAAGVLIATTVVRALRALGPEDFPRIGEITVDLRALAFALVAALVTALIFGLAPALSATRPVGRFARSGPLGLLVAVEIALSLTLLIGASLLFQSLWRLQHKNIGFEPGHILTATLSTPRALSEMHSLVAAIPGVETVAFTDSLPPNGGINGHTFSREGRPLPEPFHRGDNMTDRHVTPGYFEAMRVPLLRGRWLTDADPPESAVVNQTLVRLYFPGEDPIGKKIDLLSKAPKTIVGVVADTKNGDLSRAPMPEMDLPLVSAQNGISIILRTFGDPILAASALRQGLHSLDPRMLVTVRTMNQQFDEMTARPRFNGFLFGSFAGIALLLAAVGVYGVISFTVARRTQEIGIRMALGADRNRVIRLVLRDAMVPTAFGIAAGLLGAIAASRSLASLLYDIKPTDPATYILASLALGAVGFAAALLPARRAASVDPMTVLKAE